MITSKDQVTWPIVPFGLIWDLPVLCDWGIVPQRREVVPTARCNHLIWDHSNTKLFVFLSKWQGSIWKGQLFFPPTTFPGSGPLWGPIKVSFKKSSKKTSLECCFLSVLFSAFWKVLHWEVRTTSSRLLLWDKIGIQVMLNLHIALDTLKMKKIFSYVLSIWFICSVTVNVW